MPHSWGEPATRSASLVTVATAGVQRDVGSLAGIVTPAVRRIGGAGSAGGALRPSSPGRLRRQGRQIAGRTEAAEERPRCLRTGSAPGQPYRSNFVPFFTNRSVCWPGGRRSRASPSGDTLSAAAVRRLADISSQQPCQIVRIRGKSASILLKPRFLGRGSRSEFPYRHLNEREARATSVLVTICPAHASRKDYRGRPARSAAGTSSQCTKSRPKPGRLHR